MPSVEGVPGEVFPKARRLRKRPEFLRVQRGGRRLVSRDLVVAYAPSDGGVRVGFTVSKKVGNAVVRNRVKRILRDVMRRASPAHSRPLDALTGIDLVLIARSGASTATREQLASQVYSAVARIVSALR